MDNLKNTIEVTSATKLPKYLLDQIQTKFGENLELTEVIDESVLGGVNIRVGERMYVMTFSSQFDKLRRALKGAKKEDTAGDIVATLKKILMSVDFKSEFEEVGIVKSVKDGVIEITGLPHCKSFEKLEFENGSLGLALNLEENTVGGVVLGDFDSMKQGMIVKGTGEVMSFPVGEGVLGRVVDPLGRAIDGKGSVKTSKRYPVEKIAPGVMSRKPVNKPLQTGVKAIDAAIPIGRGQRELILGDRQTGKTALLSQAIISQKDTNVMCIYVAIGQKLSKVKRFVSELEERGAMNYTCVVFASASDPASLLYLAPYAGTALAEYYADQGKDVLIIYNNLSQHANAYREMSLLLRRPSGREAYPGDVFYLHSRLLERSGNFNENAGNGSITAIPVIETQGNDISAYIPTNVISITDGQIFLNPDLFNRGIRPAIDVGASVSRVGGNAQIKGMKKVAGKLKLTLAQYRDLEAFAQFSSDLDTETKKQIDKGKRVIEVFKQGQYDIVPVEEQVVLLYAVDNGFFDKFEIKLIKDIEKEFLQEMRALEQKLLYNIKAGLWDETIEERLKSACERLVKSRSRKPEESGIGSVSEAVITEIESENPQISKNN